ncbi:MAG: ankyrin repeat domain-containing protein [Terracidiphilus sp.]|nr:ankyrin repeat domain-containing protein [Terracidiphilus sp.]
MKQALLRVVVLGFAIGFCGSAVAQHSLNDRLGAAARDGRVAEIVSLLDKGAEIESTSGENFDTWETALTVAASHWQTEAVKTLLEHGAKLDGRNPRGQTALIAAACADTKQADEQARKAATIKLLIERGANVEADTFKDRDKNSTWSQTAKFCAEKFGPDEAVDAIEAALHKLKLEREARLHDPNAVFADTVKAFQQNPKDEALRQKILGMAPGLNEHPLVPQEARQLFDTATQQIRDAAGPYALAQPIALLRKSGEIAPWWGNVYYNLSRALEMHGEYEDAIRQMRYYLALKPAEADANEARAHLVVLETERDAAAHH